MSQIAFISDGSWVVIDHFRRDSGLVSMHPMPDVDCPIIDVTPIPSDVAVSEVMRRYITLAGCYHVEDLVREVERLGAIVIYPSAISVANPRIDGAIR